MTWNKISTTTWHLCPSNGSYQASHHRWLQQRRCSEEKLPWSLWPLKIPSRLGRSERRWYTIHSHLPDTVLFMKRTICFFLLMGWVGGGMGFFSRFAAFFWASNKSQTIGFTQKLRVDLQVKWMLGCLGVDVDKCQVSPLRRLKISCKYSYLVEVDLNNLLDTHLTSTMYPVMHVHTLKIAESRHPLYLGQPPTKYQAGSTHIVSQNNSEYNSTIHIHTYIIEPPLAPTDTTNKNTSTHGYYWHRCYWHQAIPLSVSFKHDSRSSGGITPMRFWGFWGSK